MLQLRPQILFIRAGALGDVILTTPIVREMYDRHNGNCDIDFATMSPEAFINNSMVRSVLHPSQVNKDLYDVVINLDLAYEKCPNMHITEAYYKFAFGGMKNDVSLLSPDIFTTGSDVVFISEYLKLIGIAEGEEDRVAISDPYIVLHMREHTWPSRNIPASFWQDLVSRIIEEYDINIVQVGGEHEIAFGGHPRLFNALGKFTIQQLRWLMDMSSCYIGVDSATLHVAASSSSPIVGLFTSANHEFRKPLGHDSMFVPIIPKVDCYGCQAQVPPPCTTFNCRKGTVECVNAFDVEDIIVGLKKFL